MKVVGNLRSTSVELFKIKYLSIQCIFDAPLNKICEIS